MRALDGVRRDRLRQHLHRLKCPPLPPLRELRFVDDAALRHGSARGLDARIRCASGNPRLEVGNDFVRELAAWRHLQMRIRVLQRMNQFAVGGLSRHERGSKRPALHDAFAAVEREIAFRLLHLAVVAGVTLGRKDGPNFRFEKFVGDLLRAGGAGGQDNQKRADNGMPVHGHETSGPAAPQHVREGGKEL